MTEDYNLPVSGSRWRHHTSKQIYSVLFITNRETTNLDYPVTVVYVGQNGKLWSRPAVDWFRSFTFIPPED